MDTENETREVRKLRGSPGTSGATSQSLYVSAPKIYPREGDGRFGRVRIVSVIVLLGLYYIVPWIKWDGTAVLLFDLPARQFHVFGLTLFPQDFLLLTVLLIFAALTLFFFTALAGRMWCGYACPQTVWTEVFIWMERLVEGDRRARMKLDKQAPGRRKLTLKTAKHALWITFSLWTGLTFVGYFTPIDELVAGVLSLSLSGWETFWVLFYGFATYGNAGWMREQVCIYMCPYARFQSAMFDADSLVVSYDENRGEPRGARSRGSNYRAQGQGDCINCTLCVQVCPTGIDIREGLQHQCIACAACVDVCDTVMDKMGYDRGLVRYTTHNALTGKRSRVLRPRIFVYLGLLLVVGTLFVSLVVTRNVLELDVIRDRNALFREAGRGLIENSYTLKLINKDTVKHRVVLSASGIDGLVLETGQDALEVPATAVLDLGIRVRVDPSKLPSPNVPVQFHLQTDPPSDLSVTTDSRFLGPRK